MVDEANPGPSIWSQADHLDWRRSDGGCRWFEEQGPEFDQCSNPVGRDGSLCDEHRETKLDYLHFKDIERKRGWELNNNMRPLTPFTDRARK